MFCLEYMMKENIILKSMQAKVWACVCEREREIETESYHKSILHAVQGKMKYV